jgi:uncharacterized protein with PhoU and TrkA domain
MAARTTVKRALTGPVQRLRRLVRRVFLPELEIRLADLEGRITESAVQNARSAADRGRLFRELSEAFTSVTAAHRGIADLQVEQRALRERLDMTLLLAESLVPRIEALDDGLLEARRQSLRIAELTDMVTEIVLPLHHRDIDPTALDRLRPDTL